MPCDLHRTLSAKMAWGMLYLFSSVMILWATSLVLISSPAPPPPPCEPGSMPSPGEDEADEEECRCSPILEACWLG